VFDRCRGPGMVAILKCMRVQPLPFIVLTGRSRYYVVTNLGTLRCGLARSGSPATRKGRRTATRTTARMFGRRCEGNGCCSGQVQASDTAQMHGCPRLPSASPNLLCVVCSLFVASLSTLDGMSSVVYACLSIIARCSQTQEEEEGGRLRKSLLLPTHTFLLCINTTLCGF
jgi:hypothetical protein